jgi:hypothetical protein
MAKDPAQAARAREAQAFAGDDKAPTQCLIGDKASTVDSLEKIFARMPLLPHQVSKSATVERV